MDLFALLFMTCVSFLVGVIVTVVLQYYILYCYFKKSPPAKPPETRNSLEYSLPELLKKQLENGDLDGKSSSSSVPISLLLQFLFHELRHSEGIKSWLYKKLSLEFEELSTKTTIGKFFETISIKDMHLGTQFPDLKDIVLDAVKYNKKEGYIETLSLCLNVEYTGNFLISIDAKMKFGKTAYLSIKVKKVSGLGRLQFTRHPYTHWSFSFYSEPYIDLGVESHFQGRQLQSNITNLIVNQIKKAIRRKHTLPNYKIRYKPFFVKTDPGQLDLEDSEILPQGVLEVTCVEVTRLDIPSAIQNVYCTACIDTIPWICLYQNPADPNKFNMILEITLIKLRQAQLGVIFKQEQNSVVIESVSLHSCAARSGLKPGDIVLAVENRSVTSVPQVAKFIKSISGANITLRVERVLTDSYVLLRNQKQQLQQQQNPTSEKKVVDLKSSATTTNINTNNSSSAIQCELAEEPDLIILTQTEHEDTFVMVDTPSAKEKIPSNSSSSGNTVTSGISSSQHSTVSGTPEKKFFDKIRATSPEKSSPASKIMSSMPTNENMSKFAQTIGNFSLRKRKTSLSSDQKSFSNEGTASAGSSAKNTPNSSGPGTPQHYGSSGLKHSIVGNSLIALNKKHSVPEMPEIIQGVSVLSTGTASGNTNKNDPPTNSGVENLDSENSTADSSTLPNNTRCDRNNSTQFLTEIIKGKVLSNASGTSLLTFEDEFQFNLKANMKYLNVNVWGTLPAPSGDENVNSSDAVASGNHNKDVLLGYANIPLSHILNECCNSVLGHYMRCYSFLPPTSAQPNSQTHPLMSHSGFEHVFCYGDVLLSFIWNHDDNIEIKRKTSTVNDLMTDNMSNLTAGGDNDGGGGGKSFIEILPIAGNATTSKHDFIRTQFHRTTHCDFCSKKIWLKDAVQCRECGLCCHKKCIAKCQTSTGCIPIENKKDEDLATMCGTSAPSGGALEISLGNKNNNLSNNRPEITMTEACDPHGNNNEDLITSTIIQGESNVRYSKNNSTGEICGGSVSVGGLKRVNSVNNLAIPGFHSSAAGSGLCSSSKSLPQTPARTPSRKQSIIDMNPFALCPSVLIEIQTQEPGEASESVNRLLEQVMLCPPDESLMDIAKETGRQLYADMPHEERVEKVNTMMAELKRTLDAVTLEHVELSKRMSSEESEAEKAKLAFLMGKADAKVHGLSVLMLHYCSSLQQSQEKIV